MPDLIYVLDLDEDLLSHLPDPDAWVIFNAEHFDPQMIEDEEIRQIFTWQRRHIREHGRPATAIVLADEFNLDFREPEAAIGDLIDRFRERFAKNQGRRALREIGEHYHEDPAGLSQLLLKKGRELNEVLARRGEMFTLSDIDRARHRYDKKVLAGPGASIAFPELDEYFYGMRGVTLWLAPPKSFKSFIMGRGVVQNAAEGRNAWVFSLELPAEEMDMRLRCMEANIRWWHYIRNCITPQEWREIEAAKEHLESLAGNITVHKPPAGERGIDEMVYMARDAGADVIFIDQLQYVEASNGSSIGSLNNTGHYWEVLNRARDLSDDGPICFAHQFNRQAMFCDALPPIEYAKGSSAIEEVATLVLGMWASRDMRESGVVDIGTLIARNHEYAAWRMGFDLSGGCAFEILERVFDDEKDSG